MGLLCCACHAISFPSASQSPKDTPSHRFLPSIFRISASTNFFILSYCCGSAFSSPNCQYISSGRIVTAFPHPSMFTNPIPAGPVWGTVAQTYPSELSSCPSSRSRRKFFQKSFVSKLYAPVKANTCPSPVYPMRSSLWGQSVGTST